jgi:hypothetical protein
LLLTTATLRPAALAAFNAATPPGVGSPASFGPVHNRPDSGRCRGKVAEFRKVAQAVLRHSQISMTMDVYTHVVGEDEREAVAMLAELLEDPLLG